MKCNSCGNDIVKCVVCGSEFFSGEQVVCSCYRDHVCMDEVCVMQHFSFQITDCESNEPYVEGKDNHSKTKEGCAQ